MPMGFSIGGSDPIPPFMSNLIHYPTCQIVPTFFDIFFINIHFLAEMGSETAFFERVTVAVANSGLSRSPPKKDSETLDRRKLATIKLLAAEILHT